MSEEKDLVKDEQKVEKNEIKQNNTKKKGIIAGCVAGGAVALALGLGLGLGLKGTPMYEVQLESNMQDDTLTGEGEFKKGSIVTIEAEPIDGYKFTHWNFNGQTITANPYIFELNEDTQGTYEAVYEKIQYNLAVNIDGVVTTKKITHGDNIAEFLKTEFASYTDYNTCGWFVDEDYRNVLDETTTMSEEITGLYTRTATLDKLSFTINDDNASYAVGKLDNTTEGDVVIPKYYKEDGSEIGYPVTNIDYSIDSNWGFTQCSKMTSITFPTTLKTIENFAFTDCTLLHELVIPSSVTTMEQGIFQRCTNLEKVILPEGITEIKDNMFCDSSNLKEVNIPSTVTKTGYMAFKNTSLSNVIIPASMTEIGERTFQECKSLETIIFEENSQLAVIGAGAFYTCEKLKNIEIPLSVTSIGSSAFQRCYSIKEMKLPNIEVIKSSTFSDCYSLQTLEIPSSVKTIGDYVFEYAYGLTYITIPDTVEEIGESIFSGCYALVEVYNYSSIEITQSNHFGGMQNVYRTIYNQADLNEKPESKIQTINNVNYYVNGEDFVAINPAVSRNEITEIVLDERTTDIHSYAFAYCDNLESIFLPSNSYISNSYSQFYNNSKLTNITIESASIYTAATSTHGLGSLLQYSKTINVLASVVDDANNTNTFLNDGTKYTKSKKFTVNGKEYYTFTKIS